LAVVPHIPVQLCQIVETSCHIGMFFPQHFSRIAKERWYRGSAWL
jgi:hypothetical protein